MIYPIGGYLKKYYTTDNLSVIGNKNSARLMLLSNRMVLYGAFMVTEYMVTEYLVTEYMVTE